MATSDTMTDPSDIPPLAFSMLELSDNDEGIYYVFLYNGTRFCIQVLAGDLGEGELLDELIRFKHDIDDPDVMYELEEWILASLDGLLPPFGDRNPKSLLQFYSPPTSAFKLVNQHGKLCPVQQDYDPALHGDSSPRTWIVDEMPESIHTADISCDGVVLRYLLPSVPLIPASQLERVLEEVPDSDLMDTPRKVRRIGKKKDVFFFKPASKYHGHLRELDILSRIGKSNKYKDTQQTSKLVGLVVWDCGIAHSPQSWMGFLLEYIEGETLAQRIRNGAADDGQKWIDQVQTTLQDLHQDGIVWGDVKPDNVLINQDNNAVIVDFGGGYTPSYIAPEHQQTMEGDIAGLTHMAEEMNLALSQTHY